MPNFVFYIWEGLTRNNSYGNRWAGSASELLAPLSMILPILINIAAAVYFGINMGLPVWGIVAVALILVISPVLTLVFFPYLADPGEDAIFFEIPTTRDDEPVLVTIILGIGGWLIINAAALYGLTRIPLSGWWWTLICLVLLGFIPYLPLFILYFFDENISLSWPFDDVFDFYISGSLPMTIICYGVGLGALVYFSGMGWFNTIVYAIVVCIPASIVYKIFISD